MAGENYNPEIERALKPYNWLARSPLLTIPTLFLILFELPSVISVLISGAWHLILLQSVNDKDSTFVRWHGRQALLLAGIRTAIPLFFALTDRYFSIFSFWQIALLAAAYFIGNAWGRGQVLRGECWLMTRNGVTDGYPKSIQDSQRRNTQMEEVMMDPDKNSPLDKILTDLKSDNEAAQLAAISTLGTLDFSSKAIVLELEKLALGKSPTVGLAALEALNLQTSQFVASSWTFAIKSLRETILKQIEIWAEHGLLEPHRAEVIKRRYDFDIRIGTPARKAAAPVQSHVEKAPAKALEIPAALSQPTPQPQDKPAPRPSQPPRTLTQTLLSETSIRIYLYLGAFFVIAAAAILAVLVETARLPVLLVATAIFATGAVLIKKRLPTPSFALAVIFSCLLPIDASVLAQTLHIAAYNLEGYWAFVFLIMSIAWAFGTYFYESRAFSIASFLALDLVALRFGESLDAANDTLLLSMTAVSIIGLVAVTYISRWKDSKFSWPLFLLTQVQQGLLLLLAFSNLGLGLFVESISQGEWIARAFTWILAAAFYGASGLLVPFILFPWAAVGSLYLVPWLLLSTFDASTTAFAIGFGVWGALAALASEVTKRSVRDAVKHYHLPLLFISLPLFLFSITTGFSASEVHGFSMFLFAAILFTAVHLLRPRGYVWVTALVMGLGAYFTFFNLPFRGMPSVDFSYQLLGASALLLIPELFLKGALDFKLDWRWPPVLLGATLTAWNLLVSLDTNSVNTSIVFGADALLFAAYALRFNIPWMGYLATASAAIATNATVNNFDTRPWLPVLTALAAGYYVAGFFLARRAETLRWGAMLVNSALVLGGLLALSAIGSGTQYGGWYIILIAVLYTIEMFARQKSFLELGVEILLSMALFLLLQDFKVRQEVYLFFGASLIWLASDLILQLTYKGKRESRVITRGVGGLLTVAAFFGIWDGLIPSGPSAIYLGIYALFFFAVSWFYKQPRIAHLATFFASAAMNFTLIHFKVDARVAPFTVLAVVYFAAGYLLRGRQPAWAEMLRNSGLILGVVASALAVNNLESGGGWYALIVGLMFALETVTRRNTWFEAGVHTLISGAAYLFLHDFKVDELHFILLAISLVWLFGDLIFEGLLSEKRELESMAPRIANGLSALTALLMLVGDASFKEAAIGFAVFAPTYALVAWLKKQPLFGYAITTSLALALYYFLRAVSAARVGYISWLLPMIALGSLYYGASIFLRRGKLAQGWDMMLMYSGFILGILVSLAAPAQWGGLEKALPIALTATFFAVEAFTRRNVWLGFPANGFYVFSYFVLLNELKVDEPQYYSVGAAALGMLMHYLLTRAGNSRIAFFTGMASQLVLLGTTYIQMISAHNSSYFIALFLEGLAVLAYGIVSRSRSLVIAPIGFITLAIISALYDLLKTLGFVFIIGIPGLILLSLGILGFVMRERITNIAERFSDWDA